MTPRKIALILALGLLGVGALRDLARLGDALPWQRLYDFGDFYCAGAALDERADPYRYEPLRSCEHAVNQSVAYRGDPARVVPAPLPPYDFPPFMLLARAPFAAAKSVYAVAIVLALAAAAVALSVLAVPLDVAVIGLLLPGYLLLDAGQVVPFALTALVFCGVALSRRQDALAGVLAALMLIEPHLGLPVFAAMLVLVPRSRVAAIVSAGALGLAALWIVAPAGVLEYAGRVIPAQAAAETRYVYQYSLTFLLARLGTPAAAALFLGQLSYVALGAIGIWLGARSARALSRRELLAFLPAACSVVAGSYVHMIDLPVALPAALVLSTTLRGNARNVAGLSLCALTVPWVTVWINKKLFLASLFVVATLLLRLQIEAAFAIGGFVAIAAAIYLSELWPPLPFPESAGTSNFSPQDLAQRPWAAYVRRIGDAGAGWLLIKLPTWAALAAMLFVTNRTVERK